MRDKPNFKHFTRGGQISFHNLRMWDQITKNLMLICLFFWLTIALIIIFEVIPLQKLNQALVYYLSVIFNNFGLKHTFDLTFHNKIYHLTVDTILKYPYFENNAKIVLHLIGKITLISFSVSSAIGLGLILYFVRKGKEQSDNELVRGATFKEAKILQKDIIKNNLNSDITIDGFPLIKDSEVQHLLVHGTVGTGKSQLIMKLMHAIRKRGDRAIIYDKGCSFLPIFYQENKDVILNPFDERCSNWDLWCEAPKDSDFENMAESLIPMHGESEPFWVNAARTVFTSVVCKMRHDKDRSLDKLLKLLLTEEFSSLEQYLQGTPAATLVNSKIEKTAISILSVITTYIKSLQTLKDLHNKNKNFSLRDYILNDKNDGWLFISSNGEQHKTLKPLMSMWLSMASITLLSLLPDRERRIWFICDELPSLHKLPLLGETIAEVRKFGGCFVLGMQSFSQLTKVYGQSGAKEIFDLLNTRFFFRASSSDMAKLVSNELGEEEIDETRENYSYGANSIRDGISLSNQRITRPIISYTEVMDLKNLECFLRLPGSYPIVKLKIKLN